MSETWLSIGSTTGAVRAVLKNVNVWRGLEVGRWMFTLELTTKQQSVAGCPLWVGGRIEVQQEPGRVAPYLGTFAPLVQPIILPSLGAEQTLQLTLEVSDRQLHLIEEGRAGGGLQLEMHLSGYAVQDGQYAQVSEAQVNHEISQSDWLALLRRVGYRRFVLLELEAPDPQTQPSQAEAIDYYGQAQQHFHNGEWRLAVESLRQSLSSLVGKKADDEEQEIDVAEAIKTARREAREGQLGYGPRLELAREATKFLCDLGAHPEVAETRRHHAQGALLIVGGLLLAYEKSQ